MVQMYNDPKTTKNAPKHLFRGTKMRHTWVAKSVTWSQPNRAAFQIKGKTLCQCPNNYRPIELYILQQSWRKKLCTEQLFWLHKKIIYQSQWATIYCIKTKRHHRRTKATQTTLTLATQSICTTKSRFILMRTSSWTLVPTSVTMQEFLTVI